MDGSPTRVWLEPGYDYGRFGAWMLDLPGCFVWADDRERALAAVPATVERFGSWLASHGEPVDAPAGPVIVVDEVATTWLEKEERNAIFEPDLAPADRASADRTERWRGYARTDLLALLDRLGVPSTGLPGVVDRNAARDPDRPALAVARHVGFAEIWLTGRLQRGERYTGPGANDDLREFLAGTRAWSAELLGRIVAEDPARHVDDGRGEMWTPTKVMRRLIMHSLDHLGELEQTIPD
ncbi:MAG TPA: hypothetical protein VK656_02160 [Candidatus Acidoferrum sp.]|nr:hypothetical protein [Candidatus Acidoferrum sp.]